MPFKKQRSAGQPLLCALAVVLQVFSISCASAGKEKATLRNSGSVEMPRAARSLASPPLIIGHRGAAGYLPEHTAEGYRLAIEKGADFIEPDLVMTRDHVLIVRHENNIAETTDVALKFPKRLKTKIIDGQSIQGFFTEDFTLAEIKTLFAKERLALRSHAHDGISRVVTFDEVLDLADQMSAVAGRKIGVYPETKHPTYFDSIGLPLEKSVADTLIKHGRTGPQAMIFLQSFELGSLAKLQQRVDVPRILLIDEPNVRPADFVKSGDPRTYADLIQAESLMKLKAVINGIGPWKDLILAMNISGELSAPSHLIEDAHAAGLLVHPYTFRSDVPFLPKPYAGHAGLEYQRFFELGVDAVFSDFAGDAFAARAQFLQNRGH